jgi:hypothetical protein
MIRRAEIECGLDAKATLGEGTFRDAREQVLVFGWRTGEILDRQK